MEMKAGKSKMRGSEKKNKVTTDDGSRRALRGGKEREETSYPARI
jgi:hypothetical protein